MRELLEKIVGVFPAYLHDFLELLTGPKRFVGKRLADKGRLEKALLFLGLSAG